MTSRPGSGTTSDHVTLCWSQPQGQSIRNNANARGRNTRAEAAPAGLGSPAFCVWRAAAVRPSPAGTDAAVLAGLYPERPQRHLRAQGDDLGTVRRPRHTPVSTRVVVVETDQQREIVHWRDGLD